MEPLKNVDVYNADKEKIAVASIAKFADVSKLVKLELLSGSEDLWTAQEFEAVLKKNDIKIVLVEYNGSPMSYLAFQFKDSSKKHEIVLWSLTVHPSMRRMGNGSSILKWIKGFALNECNHAKVSSILRESDLIGQVFLKANDFKCVKLIKNAYECPPENGYAFEYVT